MNTERPLPPLRLALGLLLLGGWLALPLRAEPEAPLTLSQVEAAFLYNFAKYVTWPAGAFAAADDPLAIGLLGEDPLGEELARTVAREKPVQGRALRLVRGRTAAELAHCHIIFIGKSEEPWLAEHLAALRGAGSHALTIGEAETFLTAGGVIRLVVEQNKVRFDINVRAAERAELTISSKLLSLARNTRGRS